MRLIRGLTPERAMPAEPKPTQGHTPGPWSYVEFSDSFSIRVEDNRMREGRMLAQISSGACGDLETKRANARLIAAAPDLLAVCKAALDYASNASAHAALPYEDQVRAAITKAEGQT